MRLLLCKLVEYSSVLANGRQCLIGIFDGIVVPHFPYLHPPCRLCMQFELEPMDSPNDLETVIRLIDEDGKALVEVTTLECDPEAVANGQERFGTTVELSGLVFEKPGVYRVDVLCNGETIGQERLPVLQESGPEP